LKLKHNWWFVILAAILLISSLSIYVLHYLIFKDAHHIFIFLLHDVAFLPIEVLLVGLILERVLERREKRIRLQKLNMVIGTFFSELGNDLFRGLTESIENIGEAVEPLGVRGRWKNGDYINAINFLKSFRFEIKPEDLDLVSLREMLVSKRDLLVMLLGNPNLLENEEFTELLWSVFHLLDELWARTSFDDIPKEDRNHIVQDVRRVYRRLAREWIRYCRHLQQAYPYMFAFVVKTHPLRGVTDAPQQAVA